MTCVVGVIDNGSCIIGGDVCATDSNDYSYITADNSKVFHKGEILFGCCDSFRVMNILRYAFSPPKIENDVLSYLITSFVPSLQDVLKKHKIDIDSETNGVHFLVGIRGGLYEIEHDFGVLVQPTWGTAIGSGSLAAKGSLYTTSKTDLTGTQRTLQALEAAEAIVSNVRGPFEIIEI